MAKKIIALSLCAVLLSLSLFGCAKGDDTRALPKDFRITAYVTQASISSLDGFSREHINEVTDVILFGVASFDENGKITLDESFNTCYENIKTVIGDREDKRLYINLLGPDFDTDSTDWNEQMADKARRHSNAFKNESLCTDIKALLEKYGFDGVFFDYEFTMKKQYWKDYNAFIVRLDETLGDDYKIGMSLASWDAKQDKRAREATDFVEIMSYDLWDDDGNHATMEIAQKDLKKFLKKGYRRDQLDLGLPFYARPTNHDAYWYDYHSYADKIDENGLYNDDETGLTFSFNTVDLIKQKTSLALDEGIGGVMVWHWACDSEYQSDNSLFKAIQDVKTERINQSK